MGAVTEPPRSQLQTHTVIDLVHRSHSGRERSGYKMNPPPAFAILVWDPPYSLGNSFTNRVGGGGVEYFLIWPIRGSAARQGMVLVLSVLNRVYHFARVCPETLDRVYNFAQVCPKQYTCHLS